MSQEYYIGQQLGDYEILGVLGAGGMGKVYKVRNTISDRVEAMKILLPNLAGQKELADRFLREIKLLASLNHPNIAALRTALTLDNQLVMIMEFVDGVTLSSRLQQGPLPPAEAVTYVDQVLSALSYAHKQNIIHRDIKPANMMLTAQGVVKLMDFGIARSSTDRSLTVSGTTLGSLNYMPPEQVKGEPADNRSDLYSLGVSLYELVTGQLPFQADSSYAMMAAHLQEIPKPPIVLRPGIPEPLSQIILMAMAKNPSERFQSADAFRAALGTVLPQPVPTQPAIAQTPYGAPASSSSAAPTTLFQEAPSSQAPTTFMGSPEAQPTPPPHAVAPEPAVPPQAMQSTGHRGVYIALGAFIVVAVLFAAGLYLPRRLKTQAREDQAAFPSKQQPAQDSSASTPPASTSPATGTSSSQPSTSNPATSPNAASSSVATPPPENSSTISPSAGSSEAQTPSTNSATAPTAPATETPAASAPIRRAKKSFSSSRTRNAQTTQPESQQQNPAQQAGAANNVQPSAADAAEAEEIERQYDQLDSRTVAAKQTLDSLKKQQAAQGYGLRSDIVAAEQRMDNYMSKADYFMRRQDTKNAKKYLDLAESELQIIEKFLGH